jgi:multidrug transporter EmrE-like cation transporter
MNKIISSTLLIVCGVAFSMVGDVFLKKSHMNNYKLFALGIFFYALGAVPVAFAFKKIEFGSVFLIWEAVTVIAALSIASLVFKESFTMYKAIALLLALGAAYFSYK